MAAACLKAMVTSEEIVPSTGPSPVASRPGMNWYCVHTRPRKESRIEAHLVERLGLETYFPRLKRQKTIRRVPRVVIGPLFPRYLFCRCDLAQHYRAVRGANDVIGIVSFGGAPAIVNDGLVEGLKQWAGDAVDVITLRPGLRQGDRVEITDGSMRGLQAVFLSDLNDRERVAVVLSILERDVQLTINRWQIERVD